MAKAAYPTIGIAAFVMFGIVYFIGCLRLCHIQDMKWNEIIQTDNGWRVDFTQRKTKVVDYLPISDQAYALCGERKEPERRVFEGLTGSSWISRPLKKWITEAGITKKITFHCSRHCYLSFSLRTNDLQNLNLRQVTI